MTHLHCHHFSSLQLHVYTSHNSPGHTHVYTCSYVHIYTCSHHKHNLTYLNSCFCTLWIAFSSTHVLSADTITVTQSHLHVITLTHGNTHFDRFTIVLNSDPHSNVHTHVKLSLCIHIDWFLPHWHTFLLHMHTYIHIVAHSVVFMITTVTPPHLPLFSSQPQLKGRELLLGRCQWDWIFLAESKEIYV